MKFVAHFLLAALAGIAVSSSFAADEPVAAPAKPAKPDLVKGEAAFAAKACASCHNADGNSAVPANPKLAQQHPEYLYKQLVEFKAGKRKNAVMQGMAATLSDDEMRDVAWFMGSKKIKPGFAKDKDTVALGERSIAAVSPIARSRRVPVATVLMVRVFPRSILDSAASMPEYIANELTMFRDNVRMNSIQMTGVAAKLNDREIKAVSIT